MLATESQLPRRPGRALRVVVGVVWLGFLANFIVTLNSSCILVEVEVEKLANDQHLDGVW